MAILNLCINIEHAIRVLINSHICSDQFEDGYGIVESFRLDRKNAGREVDFKKNKYSENLHEKYSRDPAVWNMLEMMSFGQLIEFYNYYFNIDNSDLKSFTRMLFCVKQIRNASAHGNCLLVSLTDPQVEPSWKIRNVLQKMDLSSEALYKKLKITVLHDFAVLLCCFKKFVKSEPIIEKTFEELNLLIERFEKNIIFFEKNLRLLTNLKFFKKTVYFFKI